MNQQNGTIKQPQIGNSITDRVVISDVAVGDSVSKPGVGANGSSDSQGNTGNAVASKSVSNQ